MQGKTDWDSAETWQRVVASMIATGAKVRSHPPSLPSHHFQNDSVPVSATGIIPHHGSSIFTNPSQPDLKAMAIAYGCTYDTLENRFRNIKKLAITLKQEIDSGERGEVVAPARAKSAPNTPRKPKTPKKDPLSGMYSFRMTVRQLPV